jgi:hypothetical protein
VKGAPHRHSDQILRCSGIQASTRILCAAFRIHEALPSPVRRSSHIIASHRLTRTMG